MDSTVNLFGMSVKFSTLIMLALLVGLLYLLLKK